MNDSPMARREVQGRRAVHVHMPDDDMAVQRRDVAREQLSDDATGRDADPATGAAIERDMEFAVAVGLGRIFTLYHLASFITDYPTL
jgi:hypothetical protein